MKNLAHSTSGRLLALAFAVVLVGSGVAKLLGDAGLLVAAVSILVAVPLVVVGLALAVEDHFGAAAYAIVILPMVAFLFEVGQALLPAMAGIPLVILGLAPLSFALRTRTSAVAPRTERAVARTA